MSYAKRRVAVYLSMLMVLSAVFSLLPNTKVSAKQYEYSLRFSAGSANITDRTVLQVKQNAKQFYIGDCVQYANEDTFDWTYLTNVEGAVFTSSNPKVLDVDKNTGKAKALKTGSVVVTAKYNGLKAKANFKVVKNITEKNDTKKIRKKITDFIKAYGNGITDKNRYKVLSESNKIKDLYFLNVWDWDWHTGTIKCTSSEGLHAVILKDSIRAYASERNPFATYHAKYVKIKSLSAKSNKITVKLNKKLTADNIFALKCEANDENKAAKKVSETKKVKFTISVRDMDSQKEYNAKATAEKGKDTVVIYTKGLKMKKGQKYNLSGPYRMVWEWNWINDYKGFTAK